MRILAMTNLYPSPVHPHRAVFNRRQLRLLGERHAVHVINPIAWTDEWRARRNGAPALPRDRRQALDGLTIEYPHYWFPPRFFRGQYGRCYRWSVRAAFERSVAEFKPEIVYVSWAYPDGWAGVQLGHQAGLPVVVKVHGSDVLLANQYPARLRKTVEALRQADGVITVSRDLTHHVQMLGIDPERIQIVYDGVDATLFRPGPMEEARQRLGLESGRPMILFVGNLVPVKGIDVLIDACARLANDGMDFTCNLIGLGPLHHALERQIRQRGLTTRVRLLGAVKHEQLGDWYRAASVFALASRSEGVPNVLLEAAACGTPFVASRVGGIPEIAHLVRSRLVPSGNAAALAGALATFLHEKGQPRTGRILRAPEEAVTEMENAFEKARERHRSTASLGVRAAGRDVDLCASELEPARNE